MSWCEACFAVCERRSWSTSGIVYSITYGPCKLLADAFILNFHMPYFYLSESCHKYLLRQAAINKVLISLFYGMKSFSHINHTGIQRHGCFKGRFSPFTLLKCFKMSIFLVHSCSGTHNFLLQNHFWLSRPCVCAAVVKPCNKVSMVDKGSLQFLALIFYATLLSCGKRSFRCTARLAVKPL